MEDDSGLWIVAGWLYQGTRNECRVLLGERGHGGRHSHSLAPRKQPLLKPVQANGAAYGRGQTSTRGFAPPVGVLH